MNKTTCTKQIQAALDALIRPCLTVPAALRIAKIGNTDLPVFEVTVAQSDMGRMVGKQGSNITALKCLLKAMSTAQHQPCGLVLADPLDIRPSAGSRQPAWTAQDCETAIGDFLAAAGWQRAVSIVANRPGQHTVMIANPLPEAIEFPLSRWLNVMGVEGQTRLVLESLPE